MEDEGIWALAEWLMVKNPEHRFAFAEEGAAQVEENAIDA